MKKLIVSISLLLIILIGCSNSKSEIITVSGSTSVADYFKIISMEYEGLTGTQIEYQAIGSSAGIKNADVGITTFGTSSREIKPEELETGMKAEIIGYEGITIITHLENSQIQLTTEEIYKIYTGEITNWSDIGGSNGEIVIVSREVGSGTRASFQKGIGLEDEDITQNSIISEGNGNVASTVSTNPNAIGYISFKTYHENETELNAISIDSIEPTAENIINGTYKLYLPFTIVYHEENLDEISEKFIQWLINEGVIYLAPIAGIIAPK